jgi:hypothetical protein
MTGQESQLILESLASHEERFDRRVDALQDDMEKINTNLMEHIAVAKAGMNLTQDIKTAVFGNGRNGFVVRVDRLERWKKRVQYAITAVVVPLCVYAGYALIRIVLE